MSEMEWKQKEFDKTIAHVFNNSERLVGENPAVVIDAMTVANIFDVASKIAHEHVIPDEIEGTEDGVTRVIHFRAMKKGRVYTAIGIEDAFGPRGILRIDAEHECGFICDCQENRDMWWGVTANAAVAYWLWGNKD